MKAISVAEKERKRKGKISYTVGKYNWHRR
jgi:hypothetical protein